MEDLVQQATDFFNQMSPLSTAITSNVIVVAVFGWFAQRWAVKRLEALKLENSQALEKTKSELSAMRDELKANIDKRMMVFQTHFELEFGNYRRLWEMCDDAYNLAARVPQYYDSSWIDDETKAAEKKTSVEMYDMCREYLDEARKMRPFIAEDISDVSREALRKCVAVTREYMIVYDAMHKDEDGEKYWDRKPVRAKTVSELEEIEAGYKNLSILISRRIDALYALSPESKVK